MRPPRARQQAGAACAASTTRECPSLSAPTGLAGGLARKRCARPWTDKALRPYYLGPPLLASDEDSAMSGRRVPNLSVGELPPPRPHLPRCSISRGRSLPGRRMYETTERRSAGRTVRRERHNPLGGQPTVQSTRTRSVVIIAAAVLLAAVAIGLVSLAGSLGGSDKPSSPPKQAAAPAAAGPSLVNVQLSDFKIK